MKIMPQTTGQLNLTELLCLASAIIIALGVSANLARHFGLVWAVAAAPVAFVAALAASILIARAIMFFSHTRGANPKK